MGTRCTKCRIIGVSINNICMGIVGVINILGF
jgi:hypothetical protein